MPNKKRYENLKFWKEFDKIPRPEYLKMKFWQDMIKEQNAQVEARKTQNLKDQGGYWGSSNRWNPNGAKGARVANETFNHELHLQTLRKAIKIIEPYTDQLDQWGIKSKISREVGLSESTIRNYIKIFKKNSQDH